MPLRYASSPLLTLVGFVLCLQLQFEVGYFLVQCWLLQHITPSFARQVEHHVGYTFLSPSLQGVGGVLSGPTKGMLLWFLNSAHELGPDMCELHAILCVHY